MRKNVTTELLRELPAGPVDIWDMKLSRFIVRVRPNGKASYLVSLGRGCLHTIGSVDVLTPHEAREQARTILGDAAKDRTNGRDPIAERKKRKVVRTSITLKAFITDHLEPWKVEEHKRGKETVQRLRSVFVDLEATKLSDVTQWTVEKSAHGAIEGEARQEAKARHGQLAPDDATERARADTGSWRLRA